MQYENYELPKESRVDDTLNEWFESGVLNVVDIASRVTLGDAEVNGKRYHRERFFLCTDEIWLAVLVGNDKTNLVMERQHFGSWNKQEWKGSNQVWYAP